MHVVKYSKILNKNLKEQAGSSFWNARMDFRKKTDRAQIHCLV